jgi:hypothetical protein
MDREKAIKATRNGAIAAFVSAAATLALGLIAIYIDVSSGFLAIFNDPLVFLDCVVILICAVGMLKRSKTAAVVIFVYFIINKIYFFLETGKATGLGTAIIFLYFYGRAIQGASALQKLDNDNNEKPVEKRKSRWKYYLGIPVGSVMLLLMGLGLLTMTSVLPSTNVLAGSQMYTKDISLLTEEGIIFPDEELLYFYSDGFLSILEEGSILTDSRVVVYIQEEGELQIFEMALENITSVELIEQGNFFDSSIYEVRSSYDGSWIRLFLSTEDKGDLEFVEELKKRIKLKAGEVQTKNSYHLAPLKTA